MFLDDCRELISADCAAVTFTLLSPQAAAYEDFKRIFDKFATAEQVTGQAPLDSDEENADPAGSGDEEVWAAFELLETCAWLLVCKQSSGAPSASSR